MTKSFAQSAREALEPFARQANVFDDIPGVITTHDDVELWQPGGGRRTTLTIGDLRRARVAYQSIATPTPVENWQPEDTAPEGVTVWVWQAPDNNLHPSYGSIVLAQKEDGFWFDYDGEEIKTPEYWCRANKPQSPRATKSAAVAKAIRNGGKQ